MFVVAILRHGLRLLLPVAIASTVYLYLYPVFHGCGFPAIPANSTDARTAYLQTASLHLPRFASSFIPSRAAPFRLLALGDPQLEGDTSIPYRDRPPLPHLETFLSHVLFRSDQPSVRHRLRQSLHDLIDVLLEDIPNELEALRKTVDLFGNDFYLAHIYRTMDWWAQPTHTAAMGDLVGSQWIDDDEFDRRASRYWSRVVRGADRVPDHLALYPAMEYDLSAYLGDNSTTWRRQILNVAGNHDIGYAGDLTSERLARFERAFGKASYELRFELSVQDAVLNATIFDEDSNPDSDRLTPELRIVVLNDMNIDTPAINAALQDETYSFINAVIETSTAVEFLGHFTLLLTHIPLYKPEGVCVDSPFFDFHGEHEGGGVKEQYQLSADASKGFLEGIFGMSGDGSAPGFGRGRRGVILNGHDHEGCDTYHYINQSLQGDDRAWNVDRWRNAKADGIVGASGVPGMREITVRSMMGDFGGHVGLLSAWFDEAAWEWRFEYVTCALGQQHIWWAIHVLDIVVLVAGLVYGLLVVMPSQGTVPVVKASAPSGKTEGKAASEAVAAMKSK
jgi:hypothetical protein